MDARGSSTPMDRPATRSGRFAGVVHVHSTRSFDGTMTYGELRELFQAHGLSFACITEHIEGLDQRDVDRIVDGCRAVSDGAFLMVPGIEMDYFKVFFVGLDPVVVDWSSNETIFRSLRAHARLCVFAHPVKAGWSYPDWLVAACDGVEIWNAKYDGKHLPRRRSVKLLDEVRRSRPGTVAVAGLDFHERRDLFPIDLHLDEEGPLSEEFVLDALAAGAFSVRKHGRDVARMGCATKALLRLRQRGMDAAHAVNRRLPKGLVPRRLKRWLRGIFEG